MIAAKYVTAYNSSVFSFTYASKSIPVIQHFLICTYDLRNPVRRKGIVQRLTDIINSGWKALVLKMDMIWLGGLRMSFRILKMLFARIITCMK